MLRGYPLKSIPLIWGLHHWRNSGTFWVETEPQLTFGRGPHSFYPFWTDYPTMTVHLRSKEGTLLWKLSKMPPKNTTNRTRNGHPDPQVMNQLPHHVPQPMTRALPVCSVNLSLPLVLSQRVENHSNQLVTPSCEFYKITFPLFVFQTRSPVC